MKTKHEKENKNISKPKNPNSSINNIKEIWIKNK